MGCDCQAVLAVGGTTVIREEPATMTLPSDQIDYVSPLKLTVRHSDHELKQLGAMKLVLFTNISGHTASSLAGNPSESRSSQRPRSSAKFIQSAKSIRATRILVGTLCL